MLGNIASYLLGYAEPNVPSPIDDDIRLTAIETDDDDWIMIEKSAISRSSSATSLPCLSLEESWFITPPPCFTSTGPVRVETSPLENLLIEHPSMSVYHRHRADFLPAEREREPEANEQPVRSRDVSPVDARPLRRPPHRRHTTASLQAAHHYLRLQNYKTTQGLKRNQMERTNKTHERNKRHCRKDKQKNHSGANNNRKCC
ncbi:hypothetical protein AAG570_012227 [Ranatra chinensis]|uniref:Tumor protein p53-inducible nuclear protein 1 n=1 Tax=Ranatra chinensis TaxID=642074 RepID=A0ABD0YIH0_9HEMI